MDSDDHRRIKKFQKNWGNDPATEKQKKYLKKLGEDPSKYSDTKGEAYDVIRSATEGGMLGKVSNKLRQARKWSKDDI